jgi:integrase
MSRNKGLANLGRMIMKRRFRLYRRNKTFYLWDNTTGKRQSLKTKNSGEAEEILSARNQAHRHPEVSFQIAKAYLSVSDPLISSRTWQHVMNEAGKTKNGATQERWTRAMNEQPFDIIRHRKLLETRAELLIAVLEAGTVSTNMFLRRLHNFALDMDWLPKAIIPRKQWPAVVFEDKRAISWEEHQKILTDERNCEWRAYYQLLWHLGGSQSDIASLKGEDIDWTMRVISFQRCKTASPVQLHFGDTVAQILKSLPRSGPLFSMISRWKESDRAKAFIRRCKRVGVAGVSLHSYRYAWAERAKTCGYARTTVLPEHPAAAQLQLVEFFTGVEKVRPFVRYTVVYAKLLELFVQNIDENIGYARAGDV